MKDAEFEQDCRLLMTHVRKLQGLRAKCEQIETQLDRKDTDLGRYQLSLAETDFHNCLVAIKSQAKKLQGYGPAF